MVKASIVIPTYKRPKETAVCLEFLSGSLGLGYDFSLEVIVVDSSPNKKTFSEIEKYQEFFKLKYMHLLKKTLPGFARNIGIKKSKNELIIIMDSDLEVRPETVGQMINYLKNHPTVSRLTGKTIFSSGENKGQTDRPTKWDRQITANGTSYIEGIYGRYEAFYKTPFLAIGGYDKIFDVCGEGTDLSIRFWRAGFPLAIDENIVAYHNTEAPESLRRTTVNKMTAMYRSLFIVAYKYGVKELAASPNFIKSHQEREAIYGDSIEFHAIVSAAESIEWFKKNYQDLEKSKKAIPKLFDFKPFDVFSDHKLFNQCLKEASERNAISYKKVFIV